MRREGHGLRDIHAQREILCSAFPSKVLHYTSKPTHRVAERVSCAPELAYVILSTEHEVVLQEEGLVVRQIDSCSPIQLATIQSKG
jgi:hypothetical protein